MVNDAVVLNVTDSNLYMQWYPVCDMSYPLCYTSISHTKVFDNHHSHSMRSPTVSSVKTSTRNFILETRAKRTTVGARGWQQRMPECGQAPIQLTP